MIVNHQSGEMMDTPGTNVQCENFLKRKMTQRDENVLENSSIYGQPNKKRFILQSSNENAENVNDSSYSNMNNSLYLNDFFNYETNVLPSVVPTSTPIYSGENYETSWQPTNDILELDCKYNAAGTLNQAGDYNHHRSDQLDSSYQISPRTNGSLVGRNVQLREFICVLKIIL